MESSLRFDRGLARQADWLVGVDEAGRGALAGPVVAGAVAVPAAFLRKAAAHRLAAEVCDSKLLKPDVRERVFEAIEAAVTKRLLVRASGSASVEEIAEYNILGATKLAMARAISGLSLPVCLPPVGASAEGPLFEGALAREVLLVIDGLPLSNFPYEHKAIVRGDEQSFVIGMASIIAKVTRDRWMCQAAEAYPLYGFASNKGYGTVSHRNVLLAQGACPLHRDLFLRKLMLSAVALNAAGSGVG